MNIDHLPAIIKDLKAKYDLIDFDFDTECIYGLGDLTQLIKYITDKTIPELDIKITEEISSDGDRYIATLSSHDTSVQIFADTDTDWLSNDFFQILETIPDIFKTDKKYYSINPAIGLTGQDAWYFCGSDIILKKARQQGLPLIFPGENITETDEFKKYVE
jgi:hypothetical protein